MVRNLPEGGPMAKSQSSQSDEPGKELIKDASIAELFKIVGWPGE